MVSFSVISYFDRIIISVAGPEIIKEFRLSETQMGSVYSAFILSYALLMVPGGHISDRFGPHRVLTVAMLGSAFFTSLTALSGHPDLGKYLGVVPSFLAIRLALGATSAPLYPACAKMNANWFSTEKRGQVWGLIGAGSGLGGAVSPLLFSWTVAHFGWRESFVLAGLATLAPALVWQRFVRDYPPEQNTLTAAQAHTVPREVGISLPGKGLTSTPWRELLTDRNIILLTLGYLTMGYFEYIFFFWIYYYFDEVRHLGRNQSAIYTTILFLTYMTMEPIGGWVSDHLVELFGRKAGRRLVPIVALSISAFLLCLGISLSRTTATVALMALALGFESASDSPFWASTIDVSEKHAGAACGILNTGSNVGSFVAPVFTPYIASHVGWSWALYSGSLILAVGALCWLFVDPTSVIREA
jgi:ACS family glucarate transporter-like MFS transporter